MKELVRARGPATVANLGPGFDVLGLALAEPADEVVMARLTSDRVEIEAVVGDQGRLSLDPDENTAGIAAGYLLARVRERTGESAGVRLTLEKGIPLASGLGSSAASAAAAARAVDLLWPDVLTDEDLLLAGLAAEERVSGRHLDNLAASLLGGLVAVAGVDPPVVHRISPSRPLYLAIVNPALELPTVEARAALPDAIPRADVVANLAALTGLLVGLQNGDDALVGRSLVDRIAEPVRAPLIRGYAAARAAALEAGALGAGISGAGPSLFALASDELGAAEVAAAVAGAWEHEGIECRTWATTIGEGACRVE